MALSWISGYNNINYLNQMIKSVEDTLSNDYNDLDNIPIIKIISSTSNPQNIWELKEGMYLIDGIVYVDNNTSYEVSNLFVSMTARLENGKYVLSAFIPFFKGLYEYILKSNSTEYEEHQIVILATHERMLTRYNETPYEPNGDYNPATKKYVDDKANEIITELDNIGVNKETITSLKEENRIRDIKLQALLSETSDRNISISEDTRYFDMPLSIDDGIVTINEMIGDTLVNVCDQEESVAITKSYTIENENHIALQGEYDGSCKPVVYGNTLVNHNADWNGNLQTGIETSASGAEDVVVEGTKGQEVSVVVEGNTVLNHALSKTSAVVSSIESNMFSAYYTVYTNVTMPRLDETVVLDGTNNDSYTINGRIKVFDNTNTNLVYGEIYTLIVDILSLPENTKLHWYIMFTDNTYQYSGTVNAASAVGKYITNITISEENKEKTFERFALYIPILDEGIATIQNPILLKGDHTTNPKYVNSNNGNYVDLTVANDMSSVVEIEGRTMVNVCDQKDPIAITKSYTVENSGNHIPLQGEYDGKCRPVIQGNTMVNLLNNKWAGVLTDVRNELTLNSTISSSNKLNGRLKYIDFIRQLEKDKVYTIVVDITSITENTKLLCYWLGHDTSLIQYGIFSRNTTGRHIVSFTKNHSESGRLGIYLEYNETEQKIATIKNVMLFEGDLTQTPELIPTEYIEGLKSSFEDGLIPEPIFTNIEGGIVNSASQVVQSATEICNGNFYTLRMEVTENTLNSMLIWELTPTYEQSRLSVLPGETGIFTYVVETPGSTINNTVWQSASVGDGTSVATKEGSATVKNLIILEGDWTHLTEKDWNNLGKYKVEYKVTGKNMLPNSEGWVHGQLLTDGALSVYEVYATISISTENFIPVHKGVTYTINFPSNYDVAYHLWDKSYTHLSDSNWLPSNINTFTPDKDGYIKITGRLKGSMTSLQPTNPEDIDTSFTIQLEEGTEATEYEPYKEYTKTFYLNSPLLEGDTIEDINGVATHVKRYGKAVLDGSEKMSIIDLNTTTYTNTVLFKIRNIINNAMHGARVICDKLRTLDSWVEDTQGLAIGSNIDCRINKSELTSLDLNGVKQWFQQNPTTVVYQLASPIYESISTESILCDSYVNGHLDFDTNVPIEKVQFSMVGLPCKYQITNTPYIIQFESDNIGVTTVGFDGITKGIEVHKGLNTVRLSTIETINNYVGFNGIGFNASNIQVVATDRDVDFGYFKGLQSSFESELVTDENDENYGKYKVDVKVTGKNLINNLEPSDVYLDNVTYRINFKKGCQYVLSIPYSNIGKYITLRKVIDGSDLQIISSWDEDQYYSFISNLSGEYYLKIWAKDVHLNYSDIQLEEGTTTTSYEPYKESVKTFYLNSPLLKGDTIEEIDGKICHYHKMGKVVFDGSEQLFFRDDASTPFVYTGAGSISNVIDKNYIYSTELIADTLPTNEIYIANTSKGICLIGTSGSIRFRLTDSDTVKSVRQWLQANPTTVVYELASPYYELIDEYNNTILDIPNTVAHLTHTSTVPVNNTVFTNYIDELNVLEANTQYRVMFDCDTANIPFTVTLGGTSQEVTSIKGTHSLLITTPSELVDKNLVIDGIGRCGIDNIRIFKGKVEYDYVKGLWSGYEERKLKNLAISETLLVPRHTQWVTLNTLDLYPNTKYTIIVEISETSKASISLISGNNDSINKVNWIISSGNKKGIVCVTTTKPLQMGLWPENDSDIEVKNIIVLEGDWTDNPPTYEEVMVNEGKYAVKVKLDTNANIFGKGGRL